MVIAFTGHRPRRIPKELRSLVAERTKALLLDLQPESVITGMAQGYDQYAAFVAIDLGIPYTAAIPHESHISETRQYQYLLERADKIVILQKGGPAAWKYVYRDKWMVDHADAVIAAWDGQPHGGTYLTLEYAREACKPQHIIHLEELQGGTDVCTLLPDV